MKGVNMKAKRLAALLLALVLVLALAAGCNTSDSNPGDSTPADSGSPSQATGTDPGASEPEGPAIDPDGPGKGVYSLPLAEERVTFTNFTSMNPQMEQYISEPYDAVVTRTLSEVTNVYFEYWTFHPSAQVEQFNIMLSSGDFCDTFTQVGNNYSGGFAGALDDEIIMDISDLIAEYAPNYSAIINSSKDLMSATQLPSGEIPAFANLFQDAVSVGNGLMIRNDWLTEQGMERPQTYDEYYDVLKMFKTEYGATLWMAPNGLYQDSVFASGFGVAAQVTSGRQTEVISFYLDGDEVKCGLLEDGFLEYLTLMNQWYSEDLIYPDFISGDLSNVFANMDNAATAIYTGKLGAWLSMTENFTDYEMQFADEPNVDIRAAYVPVQNKGESYDIGYYYCQFNSWGNSIAATVDPEKVHLLIQYFDYRYSDEGATLMEWGLEGEAHTVAADGSLKYTDLILNNPDGMSVRQAMMFYASWNGSWSDSLRLQKYTYTEAARESESVWTSNYTQAKTYPNLVIQFTADESAIQARYLGDIVTCAQEWIPQFIMGLKPLSEFEDFKNNLATFGIEEFTATYQSAYDRYNSL